MIFKYFLICLPFLSLSQTWVADFPSDLNEISGLECINDSLFVIHNDGGHEAELIFISPKAEILHRTKLVNATNVDWEDITYDGRKYLYIGDFGNNLNDRTDLCIYKVNLDSCLSNREVQAQKISFSYPEQKNFPPDNSLKNYDAETLCYWNDKLYIFTKCRTLPWTGNSSVYELNCTETIQEASFLNFLHTGDTGWWQDALTGGDINGDFCYLITYNRMLIYKIKRGKLQFEGFQYLKPITQKEAISISPNGTIYIADEVQKLLGGGSLYTMKTEKK